MAITNTWRLTVLENDQSQTARPSIGNIGATVIDAIRGPLEPLLVPRGSEKLIIDIFGRPSVTNWQVWEAIQANKEADIYISAPSLNGKYGGVLVTQTGTEAFISGQTSIDSGNIDFAALDIEEPLGTGDGVTANFLLTLGDFDNYVNQSIDIQIDGVSINVAATDAEPEVLTTTPDVGSGTYTRATGVLDFTFTSIPTAGQVITANYVVDRSSDVYFILFNGSPETDSRSTKISYDTVTDRFLVNLYQINNEGTYISIEDSPYTVSLTEGSKGDNGANIFIEDVFEDNPYVNVLRNTSLATTVFTDDTSNVDFTGGDRGDAITVTQLTAGWAYFQDENTYPVDIFFDITADAGVPGIFSDLRNIYQEYSAYLLPLPDDDATTSIATKTSYGIDDKGIYYYWNWAIVRNVYTDSRITTNLMGKVFRKHAQMVDTFNAKAPSWKDENGHGGQLGSDIIKFTQKATKTDLQALDTGRINGMIFDNNYGPMIRSQRTSLTLESDYSYIGHSRLADYLISNIISNAIPNQYTKLNDVVHRAQVKSIADAIINPLLASPNNFLREALVVCDTSNNTDAVLARREFVLDVFVKFTPFAETVKFTFINTPQGTSVEELRENF
jgi:hypothetical protein